MFLPTSTKVFDQLSFFLWKRTVEGFCPSEGQETLKTLHQERLKAAQRFSPAFKYRQQNKGKELPNFPKIRQKHILHSGRRGAASLHEPPPFAQPRRTEESERLPLGSLGTAAGWLMKRKQRVKRFPELPGRCVSGAGD